MIDHGFSKLSCLHVHLYLQQLNASFLVNWHLRCSLKMLCSIYILEMILYPSVHKVSRAEEENCVDGDTSDMLCVRMNWQPGGI